MMCHDWLSPRHVTIGTQTGKVILLEDAELRASVDVYALMQKVAMDSATAAGGSQQLQMREFVRSIHWHKIDYY